MYIDTHCHLNFEKFKDDYKEVIQNAFDQNVQKIIIVGSNFDTSKRAVEISKEYPSHIFASVGLHPIHVFDEKFDARFEKLGNEKEVIAIGETGLDYFRLEGDLEWQRERFRTHIRAARETKKPLVIHTRAAAADTIAIMRAECAGEAGGVMHCFTETWEVANAALDLGFHISFSGIVTFKNAVELKEVARRVPLDRMLIETDSPYLAPVPFRGKRNQPAWVRYVGEAVAQLRGVPVDAIARATSENFFRLFRIDPNADTRTH